jgi:hypothetical protein
MQKFYTLGLLLVVVASGAFASPMKQSPELKAVVQAIQPALKKLEPAAKVEYSDSNESVSITYLPQTFKVHGISMTGEISPKAHDEVGPSYKGFVLQIHVQPKGLVNQAVTPQTLHRPYWLTDLDVTPLANSTKQIYWALSYGSQTNRQVLEALRAKLKAMIQ